MFKCESCQKQQPPKTSVKKVVVTKKMHQHPHRFKVQKRRALDKLGRLKVEWVDDTGGTGYQTVRESNFCSKCAAKWEADRKSVQSP